ncbi:MAG: ABC transporter substrate-binding protein [Bacillota bacterium]
MRIKDDLDHLIEDYYKGKINRRTFIGKAVAMGLTMASISAFLTACSSKPTPPAGQPDTGQQAKGDPVDITVGFFPSWVGGWSGVVVKNRELWKKYLPAGSKVTWDVQVVGPPIVTNLMANKSQIGYMGDMPALVATTKRDVADLRIVEVNLFSKGQICSILVARSDAPDFNSPTEAVQWLDGKTIGVSGKGSCGDRFVTSLVQKTGIKANIQHLDPTIIKTSLQSKKIDAAQAFQPHVAQIAGQGIGKVVSMGSIWGAEDANFILMRYDFIQKHPAAAKGWIKADIEALKFVMENPYETVKMVGDELPGFSTKDLWMAIYGRQSGNIGAIEENTTAQVVFDSNVMDFINRSFQFLKQAGAITVDSPLPGAIYDQLANEAIKELGLTAPLGVIKGQPESDYKG